MYLKCNGIHINPTHGNEWGKPRGFNICALSNQPRSDKKVQNRVDNFIADDSAIFLRTLEKFPAFSTNIWWQYSEKHS